MKAINALFQLIVITLAVQSLPKHQGDRDEWHNSKTPHELCIGDIFGWTPSLALLLFTSDQRGQQHFSISDMYLR